MIKKTIIKRISIKLDIKLNKTKMRDEIEEKNQLKKDKKINYNKKNEKTN